jgi:ABC-type Na+ efflux pump permease subunit
MGSRGRTFKEAQSTVSLLLFAVSILPVVQMFMQRKEPDWLAWVPVSSQYALLARALRGEALPAIALAQSYALPLLLTAGALLLAARLLSRESVLAGR